MIAVICGAPTTLLGALGTTCARTFVGGTILTLGQRALKELGQTQMGIRWGLKPLSERVSSIPLTRLWLTAFALSNIFTGAQYCCVKMGWIRVAETPINQPPYAKVPNYKPRPFNKPIFRITGEPLIDLALMHRFHRSNILFPLPMP